MYSEYGNSSLDTKAKDLQKSVFLCVFHVKHIKVTFLGDELYGRGPEGLFLT